MKPVITLFCLLLGMACAWGQTKSQRSVAEPPHTRAKSQIKPAKKSNNSKRIPPPNAAPVLTGHDTLLEVGCLDNTQRFMAHARLRLTTPESEEPASLSGHDSAPPGCWPYAAAETSPMVGNAMAMWTSATGQASWEGVTYTRAATDATTRQTVWHLGTLPELRQILAHNVEREGPDLQDIPPHLQWEVDLMSRHLISSLGLAPETLRWRFTLQADPRTGLERIYAFECLDIASNQLVEAAIWLDRPDYPGAYFSLKGLDYERLIWQSPVQNARISRGVGPSTLSIKRPVTIRGKKNTPPRVVMRTFRMTGHHIGIDYAAPRGTPVVAVADGEVIHASFTGGYGNLIIIDHGAGHQTYYAHLSTYATDLRPGVWVRRGEEIGHVGSTGFSTGPHLHFEIRKDGLFINPSVKENRLMFWLLGVQEQPELLSRMLIVLKLAEQNTLIQASQPTTDP
jgi:murein DD-endopeptidase MepM/ murein hydrolase activator NlpD